MELQSFNVEVVGNVGHVTLAQPDRGNPFDLSFCTELSLIATELGEDPRVRAVLIDAEGKYFSVGADLKTMAGSRDELPRFIKNATVGLHTALSRFTRMPAPVVAAVQGLAVGGSVALCAAADFCIAIDTARFYAAYTGIGLVPDGGGTTFLPRRVGTRRSADFLMRNRTWTAQQALEYGLINEIVGEEELEAASWDLARELAAGPTLAYGEIKNLLLSTSDQPVEAQLELEARAMVRATHSDDGWSAVQAVLAKQKPTFVGH